MIKYLITDYKKYNIWGDLYLTDCKKYDIWGDLYLDFSRWQPLIGKALKVKILYMFWITYKDFIYDKEPEN